MNLKSVKIIAVDFDGTLCENNWPGIGAPNEELIEYLRNRKKDGDKLILGPPLCLSGFRSLKSLM